MQQDERTKIEKETEKNQQTVESSSSYEKEHSSQIIKNQILKTKTSIDYRRQVNERKKTSKTTESDPTQRDVVPNISQNLKNMMTNID